MAGIQAPPLLAPFFLADGKSISPIWKLWLASVSRNLAPLSSPSFTGTLSAPVLTLTGPTPTGAGSDVSLGNSEGIGNGAVSGITAPAQGTGNGPIAPTVVVRWLKIDIGGTKFWLPLAQ